MNTGYNNMPAPEDIFDDIDLRAVNLDALSKDEMHDILHSLQSRQKRQALSHDVLEPERIEDNAQNRVQYLRTILNSIHQGVLVLDDSLRIVTVNKVFYHEFVQHEQTLEGKFFYEIADGMWDNRDLIAGLHRVIPDEQPVEQFEIQVAVSDTDIRELMLNAYAFELNFTDENFMVVAFHDITDLVEARNAHQKMEVLLRITLESALVAVFTQDRDLRYNWIYTTMSPDPSVDVLGKRDVELFENYDEAFQIEAFKRDVLENGQNQQVFTIQNQGVTYHINLVVEQIMDTMGDVTGITGVAIDVTDQKQAEIQTILLQELTAAFSAANTMQDIFAVFVEQVLPCSKAFAGNIILFSDDKSTFNILNEDTEMSLLAQLLDEADDVQHPFYEMLAEDTELWLEDRKQLLEYRAVNGDEIEISSDIRAAARLTLPVNNGNIGAIELLYLTEQRFTREQQDFLRAIVTQCAVAMDRATLYERVKEVAMVEERQRFARDLHDSISQSLYTAQMLSEIMPQLQAEAPQLVEQKLDELHRVIRGALADMRLLLLELRPRYLETTSLIELLRYLVNSLMGHHNLVITFDAPDHIESPGGWHIPLYRIAQEALNNATRHAQPDHIHVEVSEDDTELRLIVRDNGTGFDTTKEYGGMGLKIMQERAEQIDARLHIESEVGNYTTVMIVLSVSDS